MAYNTHGGVTLIDDLAVDHNIRHGKSTYGNMLPVESGMGYHSGYNDGYHQQQQQPHDHHHHQHYEQPTYEPGTGTVNISVEELIEAVKDRELNCVDVLDHVKNCDLCKEFHKCEKSYYIAAIVVLIIICALLFKKLLKL